MILALLASVLASATPDAPLRVASYEYPKYDRTVALQPLAELVRQTSGQQVEVLLLRNPEELAAAICRGEIDVAMTNLGAFIQVSGCASEPIAVLDTPAAILDRYRGVLVARKETGIASISQLRGRASALRYSEVLPGSTSGALVQSAALRSAGVTPEDFASIGVSQTHEAGLEGLLAGHIEIAAFAEEPWRNLLTERPGDAARLTLLSRSDPLPPGPVVCRTRAKIACGALRRALLSKRGSQVALALAKGWSETEGAVKFRAYDPVTYQEFVTQRKVQQVR